MGAFVQKQKELYISEEQFLPDIEPDSAVFFIVKVLKDISIIERIAEHMIRSGVRIFHFYGGCGDLWHKVFDDVGIRLDPKAAYQDVALTMDCRSRYDLDEEIEISAEPYIYIFYDMAEEEDVPHAYGFAVPLEEKRKPNLKKRYCHRDLEEAHAYSSNHKPELLKGRRCGCFSCLEIFPPSEIKEWITENNRIDLRGTAICPYCGIDSVIGESSGYPIKWDFLEAMQKVWF